MSDSGPGRREVAHRLFAAEFDDAELSYSESDEERAPNYVVTPTGARVNRLFAVGGLTEVEDVNPEMVRGRLVDQTGAFVTYAGQYQPDALAVLERAEPPAFFSVSGKARTYEPDDGDRIYSSVRPETVREVDADTRDRWVVTAAERTLDRIGVMAAAVESGLTGDPLRAALADADVDERLADGVALAVDHYGTTPEYLSELRRVAIEAVGVVAGERDEVSALELAPGEGGGDAAALATVAISGKSPPETGGTAGDEPETTEPAAVDGSAAEGGSTPDVEAGTEPDDTGAGLEAELESPSEPGTDTGTEAGTEPGTDTSAPSDPGSDGRAEPDAEADPGATPEPTGDASEAEPTPEVEPDTGAGSDPEPLAGGAEPDEAAVTEPDDFDPGEFELDEEERREVEEEYGTEFSTADEVEPADIEPEAGDADAAEAETAATGTDEGTAEPAAEPGGSGGDTDSADVDPDSGGGDAEEVDLDEAVVELMGELDDGDGAPRDELVATATEEFGATAEAVEEAVRNALMGGQCYEPDDDTLKRI